MRRGPMIAGAVVAVLILVAAALLAVTARTSTPPFRDTAGNIVGGSIAEERMVELGGVKQYVLLRGRDRTAPLLLVLHGGPGNTEVPVFRTFNADLENRFVVVNWDQRGTSKSYSPDIDPATMTRAQLLSDLDELTDSLRAEFGQKKVVLLAHSWGTVLGVEYAALHPDKLAAYFGIGQVVAPVENDRRGYGWALEQAAARGDEDALKDLRDIGPPPYDSETIVRQRRYIGRFGGSFHKPMSMTRLILISLGTSEMSWRDYLPYSRGLQFSLTYLRRGLQNVDFRRTHTHFGMPVAFLLGRHDREVSSDLSAEYFAEIDAPARELVWFENSAHSPHIEEPERFDREVVRLYETFAKDARP